MNSLETEIQKYKKKGFKVEQKRKLTYGSRTFLKKKTGVWSSARVYIYYVDGNATTHSNREFLKDYARFYQDNGFSGDDRGLSVFWNL